MSKVNCSVIACSNSTNKTNQWKKEICTKPLSCKKKRDSLECKPPIHLHTFPGLIKYKQLREAWIKAVRREPIEKKGSWQPALRDRV